MRPATCGAAHDAPVVRACRLARNFTGSGGSRVAAVRDIDLCIAPGTVVSVLGPSGAGKTTLLCLIGAILEPTAGTLHVCGSDVAALGARARAAFRLRHVGFVFQSFRLLPALSAAENVELPLDLAGVRRPASQRRALALLDELGLAARADHGPAALSAGEQQRVAIARALALEPPLLLADEPTASLDRDAGRAVIELLCRTARQRGAALIIATHDHRVAAMSDIVFSMEDGRLCTGLAVSRIEPQIVTR
jgi:putative ABC transport system ATP-binding protein